MLHFRPAKFELGRLGSLGVGICIPGVNLCKFPAFRTIPLHSASPHAHEILYIQYTHDAIFAIIFVITSIFRPYALHSCDHSRCYKAADQKRGILPGCETLFLNITRVLARTTERLYDLSPGGKKKFNCCIFSQKFN